MFPFPFPRSNISPPPQPTPLLTGGGAADPGRQEPKRDRSLSPPLSSVGPRRNQDYHRFSSLSQNRPWINPALKRIRFTPLKPHRYWIDAEDAPSLPSSKGDAIVMMSYNILGDNNCMWHTELYQNIPRNLMNWESRRRLIFVEISERNPDLVCLQEVDQVQDFLAYMKRRGYDGIHKGRSGDAKDGCAMFWKKARFRLLEEDSIDFSSFNLRNNVAQLLVLEEVQEGRQLVIGNIHVLFSPGRGDVKLGQIRLLLERANYLSRTWGDIPIILAGDFNSTPHSAIYEFLSSREIDVSLHNRLKMSGLDPMDSIPWRREYNWTEEELLNAVGDLEGTKVRSPLKLRSSYASVKGPSLTRGPKNEPLATTCHSKFVGTVDYLWYSSELACLRVLDTLPIHLLRQGGGLPSEEIGSDHLALVAEFAFVDYESKESDNEDTKSNDSYEASTELASLSES
ncbi:carbon catabolite repressor protein 4 3 isoform X1 [Carex littledalei]|uniref:Carbon catabolite repressor protein 4 3 isoform X1 n=1 Tax=Carex littledalei TaxID=544730 RepID=A0A833VQV8_9POAL|nr:carbon catabolite repressor protein 4 3 isoform X1 [Carex littledalei]